MAKLFVVFAILTAIGAYFMNEQYKDAMAKCQIEHSYDTCFYSLNR